MASYTSLKNLVLETFIESGPMTGREALAVINKTKPKITLGQVRATINQLKRESLLRNKERMGREIVMEGNRTSNSFPKDKLSDIEKLDICIVYMQDLKQRLLQLKEMVR